MQPFYKVVHLIKLVWKSISLQTSKVKPLFSDQCYIKLGHFKAVQSCRTV